MTIILLNAFVHHRTPCIPQYSRPICPDTIDAKLSRKLSILDKDKFLLEPISPIVNVNSEVLVQDDLIKVMMLFNANGSLSADELEDLANHRP